MKAIVVEQDRLVWQEIGIESCGPGEVRIKVAATAVNRADLAQRSGGYPPPAGASPILGLECSGEVIEVGEEVQRVKVGDRVCALLAGGGYAEEVVVPAGQVLKIPAGLSFVEAASVPEVYATAYLNLYMEGRASIGEKVLLHAGASGVGTAAIQLLKFSHNPCFVTVGNNDKLRRCVELGADSGFVRHNGSFAKIVSDWAGDAGVDVVLDPVGASYMEDNLSCLTAGGRLVIIGLLGGQKTDVNLGLLMMKRISVIGSTLRARPISEKSRIMDELKENLWPRLESGEIKPIIEAVLPVTEAEKAHELIAGNETFGKVVLEVSG